MKNIKTSLIVPVVLLCAGNAFAATQCGIIRGSTINIGSDAYMCIRTTGTGDTVTLNSNYTWACLTYSTDYQSDADKSLGHHYLQNCSVTSYSCVASDYYTGNGCSACPTGGRAYVYDGHTQTSCEYCTQGYYFDGTACVPCPDGGTTVADIEYWRSKNKCFLMPGEYSDESGNFRILPPLPGAPGEESGFCYWTE